MEKKNTVLLTVIAIATLLVAVVGATFAYFAASVEGEDKTTITTTTQGVDAFAYTPETTMSLDVTTALMAQAVANNTTAAVSDEKTAQVTLTAGSGEATCTYDLVWNELEDAANSVVKYQRTPALAADGKEYTLSVATSSNDLAAFPETNIDNVPAKLGSYTITNAAADNNTTTQEFTFKVSFYNLVGIEQQALQANKKYSGEISISNIVCNNGGNVTFSSN